MAVNGKKAVDGVLVAEYAGTGGSKTFELPQQALSDKHSTEEKTAYLAALRESVVVLREQMNAFLTEQMELDKITGVLGIDDPNEEENYGEEVVEET